MTIEGLVFDLDGTLLDSDAALIAPFLALGVAPEELTFGHVIAQECDRLGLDLNDYLEAYDTEAARPFDGVDVLVERLERWAICSNKHPRSAEPELERLGWKPEQALFSNSFDGPKRLEPVLDALELSAADILFVGDTAHDRATAHAVGATFVLAGWNPRVRVEPGDLVAERPEDILAISATLRC